VSAQQARERKKQYVTTLEDQLRQHQDHIQELEEQLQAAHTQNSALRKIIQSMQADKLQASS
jgi:TolA-binding protein